MAEYPPGYNQPISNADIGSQYYSGALQFNDSQYQSGNTFENYSAGRRGYASNGNVFSFPQNNLHRSSTLQPSDRNSYPSFTQEHMDALPPWTDNTTNGT